MNFQDAKDIIRLRFKDEIQDVESIAVQYDNDGLFKKPDSGVAYIRFNIKSVSALQVETGKTKRYRRNGLAMALLFYPFGKGDKDQSIMQDKIILAFEGTSDSDVHFKTAYPETVGRDGGYWQENTNLPFYFDEVK